MTMEGKEIFLSDGTVSYLNPLFWQHNEEEDILKREIATMHGNGIGSFIVESRPHPDYLGPKWWKDLDLLIREAKAKDMKVWLFDDGIYPSGTAGGRIKQKYPNLVKKYIAEQHIDAGGPMTESSFYVQDWLQEQESLLCVLAAERIGGEHEIDGNTLINITDRVEDGIVYWDVPEGEWRIFIIKITQNGGEEYTRNYLNPLDYEATSAFIELVYEEHFQHFREEFGKTVAGFFTDEPRFGSAPSYTANIGTPNVVLPYSDTLLEELGRQGLGDFVRLLPCLWYPCGEMTPDARYAYMNVVSRKFGENFLGQMGAWCRAHGVKLIGHVVEENGAHARLGYGPGHFFRAMQGLDAAGMDVVCNVYPGKISGNFTSFFNFYDTRLNHWGLAKLTSSAAHIDPKKNGRTYCEAFGAYGWTEGLKTMKWVTDNICVRGVNHIIPHAFSPAAFPDQDCPPHFYAGGHNPQFRNFGVWADYANRICHLLNDGQHIAPVAVLYHAEAEWGGAYQPFEAAVKALMEQQIDCDVVPVDIITDERQCTLVDQKLCISKEEYSALVIPYAEYLPKELIDRVNAFARSGLPVVFTESLPARCYFQKNCLIENVKKAELEQLADWVAGQQLQDISLSVKNKSLAYYHYRKQGRDLYFFVNQDIHQAVHTTVHFGLRGNAYFYDAMSGRKYTAQQSFTESGSEIALHLEPYESLFVVFGMNQTAEQKMTPMDFQNEMIIDGDWRISLATAEEYPAFSEAPLQRLENISRPHLYPKFSGTVRYEMDWDILFESECLLDLGSVYEIAEVYVNDSKVDTKICPPYRFSLQKGILHKGVNKLRIEVTNTLVKSSHHPLFDKYWAQEPSGLLGPVRILY